MGTVNYTHIALKLKQILSLPFAAHFARLPVPLARLLGLFLPNLPPLALHYLLPSANTNVKCKLRPRLLLLECGGRPASVTAPMSQDGPAPLLSITFLLGFPYSFVLWPITFVSPANLHRRGCSALQTSKPTSLAWSFFSFFSSPC